VAAAMTRWRRLLPPILAALAFAYLGSMVVSGAMPVQRQLVRFEAKGLLAVPPERIARVQLQGGGQAILAVRRSAADWATPEGTAIGTAGTSIGTALRMMRNSPPVRELAAVELVGVDTTDFGLDPPLLSVRLLDEGGELALVASFGSRNPEGYLQYMRIDGDARLFLMSRFVGEEWGEALAAAAAAR
jgi:hypothetical protein